MPDPLVSTPLGCDVPMVVGLTDSFVGRDEVQALTERLFGSIAHVKVRCDPEIYGETSLEFRVVEEDADAAFGKHEQWLRELLDLRIPDSHRFHLSVIVRE